MRSTRHAFTIIELLTVIGIIAILAAIALPTMSRARDRGRTVTCQTRLRQFASGWDMYVDQNDGILVPARMFNIDNAGSSNPANWYDVGNGLKYRPRWPATLGFYFGIYAFNEPLTQDKTVGGETIKADRQNYDNEVYQCPTEPSWNDERNYGYGYNYQFLGNSRRTNERFHNFPVYRHKIKVPSGTVLFADSLGTAAAFGERERGGYIDDDDRPNDYGMKSNHGYTLDPPRLTAECDRGTGDDDSTRTAVDARHQEKASVVFADGHGAVMEPYALGYRQNKQKKCYVDYDPADTCEGDGGGGQTTDAGGGDPDGYTVSMLGGLQIDDDIDGAHNRLFSGSGRDDDPPEIPEAGGP